MLTAVYFAQKTYSEKNGFSFKPFLDDFIILTTGFFCKSSQMVVFQASVPVKKMFFYISLNFRYLSNGDPSARATRPWGGVLLCHLSTVTACLRLKFPWMFRKPQSSHSHSCPGSRLPGTGFDRLSPAVGELLPRQETFGCKIRAWNASPISTLFIL